MFSFLISRIRNFIRLDEEDIRIIRELFVREEIRSKSSCSGRERAATNYGLSKKGYFNSPSTSTGSTVFYYGTVVLKPAVTLTGGWKRKS